MEQGLTNLVAAGLFRDDAVPTVFQPLSAVWKPLSPLAATDKQNEKQQPKR